ncbi:cysteine hydrolase [Gemmobacter sp.]|uniref:cysteine hydrolase family protein n=1 Tax=Gemmobacter sp. TaxID=1898957 RepID=UPI002AFE11EF|nr:cysteine hydrolase [Gemmobacter sp.]
MARIPRKISAKTTALLIVDMQNDFVHDDGAYVRGGARAPEVAALPERLAPLVQAARAKGIFTVATQFTLVPGRGGEPMIADHLRELRPFLRKGDFHPGSWGQQVLDALSPVDTCVEKVAFSAFYQSRLEYVLKRAGIDHVLVCGIVTNGGVASTARDAHVRDLHVTVLSDGCAAPKPSTHEAAIADLANVVAIQSCADALTEINALA